MKIILFRLGSILLFILLGAAVVYAQSDTITGTINDSNGCVQLYTGLPWGPADNVQFGVTKTGNYTFSYDSDTIANIIYFYMLQDNFDDTQAVTAQPGYIGRGSEVGEIINATLEYGRTYFMITNNNQGAGIDKATCEARSSTTSGDYVIRATGDGLVCIGSCPQKIILQDSGPVQAFWDDRINDYDTGNPVVLYGKHNDNDEWRLEVYNADSSGMLFYVTAAQIAAVPECPDSATLIYADDATSISFWRLPQQRVTEDGAVICPFQLNAPTGEPGKVYIIIFDTLYPHTYYTSWEEFIGN